MKRRTYQFAVTACILSMLSGCSKDNTNAPNGNGPNLFVITEGFLSTLGRYYNNTIDTLTYVYRGGSKDLSEYGFQYRDIYSPASFSVNSNGTVSIKLKEPYVHQGVNYYYFSVSPTNPAATLFPENEYQIGTLKAEKTDQTEFVITRDDLNRKYFSIESKKYPGNYLDVAKWKNGGTNGEQWLVFTKNKKAWFFIPD